MCTSDRNARSRLPDASPRPRAGRRASALALAVLLLAGCAGEGPDVGEEPNEPDGGGELRGVDFARDVQPIFDRHCSCHLTVSAPQGVILLAGSSYPSLVDRTSTGNDEFVLVAPGEPERSYLMIKLDDDVPGVRAARRGDRMPPARPPLDAGALATIRRWIVEGAKPEAEGNAEPDTDASPPVFAGAERARAAGAREIEVFWSSAMDDRTPVAEILYRVYLAAESGTQDFTRPTLTAAAGSAEARLGGLAAETEYFAVVRAVDAAGNEDANTREVSARTLADEVPEEPSEDELFPRDDDVERICSTCHGIRIVLADGTRGEITPPGQGVAFFPPGFYFDAAVRPAALWASTISRMRRQNGAAMSDAEEEDIRRYFVENFSEPP